MVEVVAPQAPQVVIRNTFIDTVDDSDEAPPNRTYSDQTGLHPKRILPLTRIREKVIEEETPHTSSKFSQGSDDGDHGLTSSTENASRSSRLQGKDSDGEDVSTQPEQVTYAEVEPEDGDDEPLSRTKSMAYPARHQAPVPPPGQFPGGVSCGINACVAPGNFTQPTPGSGPTMPAVGMPQPAFAIPAGTLPMSMPSAGSPVAMPFCCPSFQFAGTAGTSMVAPLTAPVALPMTTPLAQVGVSMGASGGGPVFPVPLMQQQSPAGMMAAPQAQHAFEAAGAQRQEASLRPDPPVGGVHAFHVETQDMGTVSPDYRRFTKVGFEGRLSVVSEREVHQDGVHRYLVQFTSGDLSRADGVGFVFSNRLPCAKNIQKIVSIFVNQQGRICMRIFAEVIRASACMRPLELGDWLEMIMDLDHQVASFKIWPCGADGWPDSAGRPASTAVFPYGQRLTKLNQGHKHMKLNVGHLACVIKNVGVTVTLAS